MLLILGDSYAARIEAYLDPAWPVTCAGWPGAQLGDELFRRWAIRTACELRPQRVLLLVGSSDFFLFIYTYNDIHVYMAILVKVNMKNEITKNKDYYGRIRVRMGRIED